MSYSLAHEGSRNSVNPLQIYLEEIHEAGLLTADEEVALAERIQQGDMEAKKHLIRSNLRLVVSIARLYTGNGLSLQDLIQEGNIGLEHATALFDPGRGTRFTTYATYWVKQSIKRGIIDNANTVRVPAYLIDFKYKYQRLLRTFEDEKGCELTDEEAAARLQMSVSKFRKQKRSLFGAPKMETEETIDDEYQPLVERAPADIPFVDERLIEEEDFDQLWKALDQLDYDEREIVKMRTGILDTPKLTAKEVGELVGLTRERVLQIYQKALHKMQNAMNLPRTYHRGKRGQKSVKVESEA